MAFGQSPGPPATGKQVNELLELLEAAGHSGFRDARGPMGFNQRQAGGRFSRDEADAFIERLQSEIYGPGSTAESIPSAPASGPTSKAPARKPPRSGGKSSGRSPATKSMPAKGSWRSNLPNAEGNKRTAPTKAEQPTAKVKDVPTKPPSTPTELQGIPDALLAAELERRGWTVSKP